MVKLIDRQELTLNWRKHMSTAVSRVEDGGGSLTEEDRLVLEFYI